MKRTLLLSISLFALTISTWGGKVTQQQALQKAASFLRESYTVKQVGTKRHTPFQMPELTTVLTAEQEALYVINIGENGGFIIVSGDDRTESILGFVQEGSFLKEDAPENLKAWLKEYERQIMWIQEHGIATRSQKSPNKTRTTIAPLVKTFWDQHSPYNLELYFPEYFDQLCLTGCVATALAQVMYYHQWPTSSCNAIPEYTLEDNDHTFSGLSSTTFNWSTMKTSYNATDNDASAQAVATLMRYCGQSVEMDYGTESSGAPTSFSSEALKKYFGYDEDIRSLNRSRYSDSEWDELIYQEVNAGRPVIYSGTTANYFGHAFIVDGYKDGKYHINWGWGGHYNGHFLLSVADPYHEDLSDPTQGTEAYAYDQEAVIGIQKPDGIVEDFDRRLDVTDLSIIEQNGYSGVIVQVANFCGAENIYDYGIGVIDRNGNVIETISVFQSNIPIPNNYWFNWGTLPIYTHLNDGRYTVGAVCKLSSENQFQTCINWEDHRLTGRVENGVFSWKEYEDNGIATGIDSAEKNNPTPTYYLLNGMRVKKPGKGIVIVNGKKGVR